MTIKTKTKYEQILSDKLHRITDAYNAVAKDSAKMHDALHEITQLQDGVYELSDARVLAHEGLAC